MEKNKIKSCHNPFDSKLKMKINENVFPWLNVIKLFFVEFAFLNGKEATIN
jgi:hypothetical protein